MGRLPLALLAAAKPAIRLSRPPPRLLRYYVMPPTAPSQQRRHSGYLDFPAIDEKWRTHLQNPIERPSRPKFYICSMFPYPSGTLHMGHLRVYTISDTLSRFRRMQGYNVIHPMGWDAFGLPAENAAIEHGVDAKAWTEQNIDSMKSQLVAMGVAFDWGRELKTCSPEYYEHTQRLFLLLYKHGLAYRAQSMVNWDPVDMTVLANEQVSPTGHSWRSGAVAEKKMLKQWFLKITKFKKALLDDLIVLRDKWPENVRIQQMNWIGKSQGANIKFPIEAAGAIKAVEVFTTRADTLPGVQYLALSTSHPIVKGIAQTNAALAKFIRAAEENKDFNKHLTPDGRTKKGFLLPETKGVNPLYPKSDPLPVFVAEYVIDDYGEGAVMGVPGHDTRDNAFWKENCPEKPISTVIRPGDGRDLSDQEVFTAPGILKLNCGEFAELNTKDAKFAIVTNLRGRGRAEHKTRWKLRDWLISRQRYWGTPIPMVHCGSCGVVPVNESDLPVMLPEGVDISGKGGNPLANVKEWVETSCPKCGKNARRDTDTMDTFVDSSWYFMRFIDPQNLTELFSKEKANSLLPVDVYIGGVEHAILHLLYSRFIAKFLCSIGLWPTGGDPANRAEPFKKLIAQGMVHGKTYSHPDTGQFLKSEELSPDKKTLRNSELAPTVTFEKMSKSKYNGVDPTTCITQHGADATRAHVLFQAPVGDVLEWNEKKIIGIERWFGRVWGIVHALRFHMREETLNSSDEPLVMQTREEKVLWREVQRTIKEITRSFEDTIALNTVISTLTKLTNTIKFEQVSTSDKGIISLQIRYKAVETLLRMMAPVAPGFAEECWEALHVSFPSMRGTRVLEQPWPSVDEVALQHVDEMIRCAIQVNGKVRFVVDVDRKKAADMENGITYVTQVVMNSPEGQKWLGGPREVQQAILAAGGRTINYVI